MSVKLIVDVSLTSEMDIDFRFEIDDSKQADGLERKVAESMAGACLIELQRISDHTDGAVIEGDDGR